MFDRILDPTGLSAGTATVATSAGRVPTLVGARVGLLCNTKKNAAQMLAEIGRLLESRYGAVVTIQRTKPNVAWPVDEPMLNEIKAVSDVVVAGVGDCGSCSASAAADGIAFERAGLPTAVICSDAFEVTARAMAEVHGDKDFEFLLTPHPVAVLTEAQVAQRAEDLAAVVAGRLCEAAR
jgi:hypothetical protein